MKRLVISLVLLLIGQAPVHAQDAPCVPHVLRPIMATHTQPPYPDLATSLEEEGKTLLKVSIGPDGVPTDVIVVDSSGSVRLDSAAAAHIRTMWKWQPTMGSDCVPMKVETRVQVTWSLHDSPPADSVRYTEMQMAPADYPPGAMDRKEQGFVAIVITVPADGSAPNYVIGGPSNFPDLDNKALEIVKTRYHWKAGEMNGKPVVTTLGVVAIWTLPPPAPPKQK